MKSDTQDPTLTLASRAFLSVNTINIALAFINYNFGFRCLYAALCLLAQTQCMIRLGNDHILWWWTLRCCMDYRCGAVPYEL